MMCARIIHDAGKESKPAFISKEPVVLSPGSCVILCQCAIIRKELRIVCIRLFLLDSAWFKW